MLNNPITIRVSPDLRAKLQSWLDRSGQPSVSDGMRTLLLRGLFLDERPAGRFSEAAFAAAYFNYRAQIMGSVNRWLRSSSFEDLLSSVARQGGEGVEWLEPE